MKKVCMVNGKGGAGKSTVTALLAMTLSSSGVKTAVLDLDNQGTVTNWLGEADLENVALVRKRDSLKPYNVLLIDTPGKSDLPDLIASIPEADLYVVPSRTTLDDQKVARRTVASLREKGVGNKIRVLFNQIDNRARDSRSLAEYAQAIGCDAFHAHLAMRKGYAYAQVGGWRLLDSRAQSECRALALEMVGAL
jgi:chromosome partitioning protein